MCRKVRHKLQLTLIHSDSNESTTRRFRANPPSSGSNNINKQQQHQRQTLLHSTTIVTTTIEVYFPNFNSSTKPQNRRDKRNGIEQRPSEVNRSIVTVPIVLFYC